MNTMWDIEILPQWQDYVVVIFFALLYPLVRFLLDTFVYQESCRSVDEDNPLPRIRWAAITLCLFRCYRLCKETLLAVGLERLAEWVMHANLEKGFKSIDGHYGSKKVLKFMESAWKLTYYGFCVAMALVISYKEPWFCNTGAFWPGWPHQTLNGSVSSMKDWLFNESPSKFIRNRFQLKFFYILQCGFYIYSVMALLFWETRRKDFSVMMSHHVITIGLISYSYITGSFRVGSIVLALHDVSDVLLESAKLCKYSQKEVGASLLFGLFTLSWALLRLGYFPFWIIRSTSYDVVSYVDKASFVHAVHYYAFNTMLITLLVIHIYWWMLICRMISKQLQMQGKIPNDVRSDSDED